MRESVRERERERERERQIERQGERMRFIDWQKETDGVVKEDIA